MRFIVLAVLGLTAASVLSEAAVAAADPVYAPLRLYAGTWHTTRKDLAPGAKPDEIVNECALVGKFFVCQQNVNGSQGSLMIFVPAANKPGHYYTQGVVPEGRATGRGDLEISGDRWVYSSNWDQGGKTTYYRTTNVFNGKDHIHYEQAESSNGKDWKVTNYGDEVRVPARRR